MPTIQQLPQASQVNDTDEVPLSQGGITRAASIAQILAATQPAQSLPPASLLGRAASSAGAPQTVAVGVGLSLSGGQIAATGADHAAFPAQNVLTPTDDVVLHAAGTAKRMPVAMLRGLFSAGANVSISSVGQISAPLAEGPQGAAGLDGQPGPVGPTGPVGSQGPVGPIGATGPQGAQGAAGAQGIVGAVGAQGPAGIIGAQGPAGVIGAQGPAGVIGAQGPAGTIGAQGPAGTIGAQGPAGAIGAQGAAGSGVTISGLAQITSIASGDLIGVSQSGADRAITYANLLNGQTIDAASPAAAVADTDGFWVGQGGTSMLRQSFSGVWSWVAGKLPGYKRPVLEITAATTLDTTVHNGRVLLVTQPITFTPNFTNMGSGFVCDVINLSGGNVTFAAGITTSSGATTLPTGQAARLIAASGSGGNAVYAAMTGTAALTIPGQVTGLTATTTSSSTVALAWSAPASGGAVSTYTVNYRVTGASTWTTASAAVTAVSFSVTGLTAVTNYEFQIMAVNAAGSGTASATASASTSLSAPGQVTGLAAGTASSTTMPLTWTAPASGGAVATYTVQYRVNGGSTWTTASSAVTGTSYSATGLVAATSYNFQVIAVNAAGSGMPSAMLTASTTVAAPAQVTGLAAGTATSTTMPLSWTAPATGGTVATYTVNYRVTGSGTWVTASAAVAGVSYTVTGLSASTSYEFQVFGVNAGGSGTASATVTASTAAASNYLLTTGFQPVSGATATAGTGTVAANANDNSATVDGSKTVPASVKFGLSTSNTTAPASFTNGSQFANSGHNYWAAYVPTPTTAGTYFVWARAFDSGSNQVAQVILANTVAVS